MQNISQDNWFHVQFVKDESRAIISCGAQDTETIEYFITVLDENDHELFQERYTQLDTAIENINARYAGIWELDDVNAPAKSSKDGGCSTCVAH